MKALIAPIMLALGTACCWGMYGSALAKSRVPGASPFKPYIFIGVAYLVWSVIGGIAVVKMSGQSLNFTGPNSKAMIWGFLAGTLGAFGAFFLTSSVVASQGKPAMVMPIVFGGAVTVNALAAWYQLKGAHISPLLWVGMCLVAVGIVLVASNTPHGAPPKAPPTAAEPGDSPTAAPETSDTSPTSD